MAWADTVFCEWAGRQAVWYSHHLPAGKRLVVRLHGFESDATWIGELDFSRVNQLIAVSNFYRKQLVKRHGWDEGKVSVIGNSVTFDAFTRPKDDEARFHLGMLGYTPLLKRPQVAVEILRYLVQQDDRFVLHLEII
nr:glycosyltransferase [Epilithonimonas vandammei]